MLYVSPPDPRGEDEELRTPQGREDGKRGVEYAFVIEVLKDTIPDLSSWLELSPSSHNPASIQPFSSHSLHRSERPDSGKRKRKQNRSQRWAPFTISPDGLALQDAFPGATAKPMFASGQMYVMKQLPFGRQV
jgi:hypothetical protein